MPCSTLGGGYYGAWIDPITCRPNDYVQGPLHSRINNSSSALNYAHRISASWRTVLRQGRLVRHVHFIDRVSLRILLVMRVFRIGVNGRYVSLARIEEAQTDLGGSPILIASAS